MTDFNKGDFTQQGVDGHVNAKVRLNAKRYLDIDLTSDEEASGCTISGHVYDSLNDITYPIGSTNPTGNIAITENTAEGEPLNIAQYATATVNVPQGGGIPYFTATIENNSGVEIYSQTLNKYLPYGFLVGDNIYINDDETLTENFMYNGVEVDNAIIYFINPALGNDLSQVNTSYSNLVNCTVNVDNGRLMITDPSQNASATITVTGLS